MIRWTDLAPFEYPFPGSLASRFLGSLSTNRDWVHDDRQRGTTRAQDAQGTLTQSHISQSILAYEDKIDSTPP